MASISCSPCGVACISGTKIVQVIYREESTPEKNVFDVDENKDGIVCLATDPDENSFTTTGIPSDLPDGINSLLQAVSRSKRIFPRHRGFDPYLVSPARKQEENSENVKSKETNRILACRFSPSWKYFAVCDDLKRLYLYDSRDALKLLSLRSVVRRATSLTFTRDEASILVADKSGDVYRFSVLEPDKGGHLLLGHLSMLLDIVMTKEDKCVVTCDRDEKIRISNYPNAYDIKSFCLHHTQYVTSLVYIEDSELIVSGSGDGSIIVWNTDGKFLTEHQCHNQIMEDDLDDTPAVKQLIYKKDLHLLAATFFGISNIKFYEVRTDDQDVSLEMVENISLQCAPWDMSFDNDNRLWVLQPVQDCVVQVFHCGRCGETKNQYKIQKLEYGTADSSNVGQTIKILNDDWDFFNESVSVPDFSQGLKKIKLDNVTEYLQKKKSRLDGKTAAVKSHDSLPPEKKIKSS